MKLELWEWDIVQQVRQIALPGDHIRMRVARIGCVGNASFTKGSLALLWNHRQQQTDHLTEELQTMLNNRLTQEVTALVVPISAFAG